ncbi:serine/threonine-protein kinase [Haliangium ochraceum]|nr:serine/threonine-protein kinase [Haliangium ochraceum]
MKLCPKCGTKYPDEANFCPVHAARLVPASAEAESEASSDAPRAAEARRTRAATDGRLRMGGRFKLGDILGGRQTGEVYQAEDDKSGRACVVKWVDPVVFPNRLVLQRTARELDKLARLDIPGVAKILGHGIHEDRLWIASERVSEAQSLLDIVFDDGPMAPKRAAALIIEIGKAVSEAAKAGVIHRDLAPKNVLLGAGGVIKLINFGVAMPATNKVAGVPEFVAPEIVEGKSVDQRANIYSLGALFYYLVAGRPPYMGEPEEVHQQHLSAEPEPPSLHVEGVSHAVDAVIARALARSSSRRFMTIRQFLNDVERLAAGEEPSAASALAEHLLPARGKGRNKPKKLAQTMLGGFQVAQEAAAAVEAENRSAAAAKGGDDDEAAALPESPALASEPGANPAGPTAVMGAATVEMPSAEPEDARDSSADDSDKDEASPGAAKSGTEADKDEGKDKAGSAASKSATEDDERARLHRDAGPTELMSSPRPKAKGSAENKAKEREARERATTSDELESMKSGRGAVIALIAVAVVLVVVLIVFAMR